MRCALIRVMILFFAEFETELCLFLGFLLEQFDSSAQIKFKGIVAEAVTYYCAGNSGDCQGRSVLAYVTLSLALVSTLYVHTPAVL